MKTNPRFRPLSAGLLACLLLVGCSRQDRELQKYADLCRRQLGADYELMYRPGGEGAFVYPYLTPGSHSYSDVLWDWDSWLTDIALRQVLPDSAARLRALEYERGCVLNFLAYADADGYVPIGIDRNTDPRQVRPADVEHANMHKPVLAQHAAFLTQQDGGDASWLADGFDRIAAFEDSYLTRHRHAETGLLYWQDDMAVGVDTDPAVFYRPARSCGSIFLNCLMYRELLATSYLARCLGRPEDASRYQSAADRLCEAVRRHCWDPRDGMYYSADLDLLPANPRQTIFFGHPFCLHEGGPRAYACLPMRLDSWTGFMALWAGIATPEQALRMESRLRDGSSFWAPYGVRTLSPQERMYSLAPTHNPSNWNGPVWGVSNYLVFRGLVRYGLDDSARELARRTVLLFGRDLERTGTLHEFYHPDTGEGLINPGFQNWNYLVLNMISWLDTGQAVAGY